ncbi:MAG TPA: acyloxyacyl hydrolase [Methylomirabilota bacterium]|jgi:hypothetical protein|nr:acyloxyacyl hydrolase [Methylomirabilota bacterium]
MNARPIQRPPRVPTRRAAWSFVAALGLLAAGLASSTAAGESLTGGTKDLTFAGGFSISHNFASTVAGISGFQVLPHLGLFVTDEWGPGWARGNLELIAEPTFLHLDTRKSTNHVGASGIARWVLTGSGRVRSYVELGVGLIVGESGIPQTTCDPTFVLQAGVGALFFFSPMDAVTLGYRFQHLSNAAVCTPNPGFNSSVFILGLSHFFP